MEGLIGCLDFVEPGKRVTTAILQMMAAFGDTNGVGLRQDFGDQINFALSALSFGQVESDWTAIYPYRELLFYLSGYIHIDGRMISSDSAEDLKIEISRNIYESVSIGKKEKLHELSGSFLILFYDLESRTLSIVTDKLGSRPLFYLRTEGTLYIASELQALLQLPEIDSGLDPCSVAEYLRFGTIFENRTLYENIQSVSPASILKVNQNDMHIEQYWSMTYDESWNKPDKHYVEALVDTFKLSIGRLTNGFENSALMLSGGLDSRMIAASIWASGNEVKVISFGGFENDEVKLARRLAKLCGFSFSFLKRDPDYYQKVFPNSVHIGGGMFPFYHAHMLALHEKIHAEGIGTLVHGWGLDVLFSGTYFPKRVVNHLPGRSFNLVWPQFFDSQKSVSEGLYAKLALPSDDLIEKLPGGRLREIWQSWPKALIIKLVENSRDYAEDYYNQYEWVLLHDISRFRSFLYPLSIRWGCKDRCPLYDSQILEMYLSMPPRLRFCSRAYGKALAELAKPLARIPYSRTGVSIGSPEIVQTCAYFLLPAIQAARFKGRQIFGRYPQYPEEGFDSYPKTGALLRQESFRLTTREYLYRGILSDLGLVDDNVLERMLDRHHQGKSNYGDILCELLSLAQWLTMWS